MIKLDQRIASSIWEIPFQVGLFIIVFIFYSFDGHDPGIHGYQLIFYFNYVFAAICIDYILFPAFLYRAKYTYFFSFFVVIIAIVIINEEFFIEKVFFPDTRGKYFRGIFYSLLDVMPVVVILSGFKLAWDIIRKQQQVENLKATVEESEIRFLKSQINPHFLFNHMNNLYSYALEGSPKTPEIILEMSSFLRYMLYDCRKEFVSLETEVAQMESYVRLYELQIEGRGQVSVVAEGISDAATYISPLILMVFVENAFKHCAANEADEVQIEISVKLENHLLLFRCKNTCSDLGEPKSGLYNGIGLENVRKRLSYVYPSKHQLQFGVENGYYLVDLTIDLSE